MVGCDRVTVNQQVFKIQMDLTVRCPCGAHLTWTGDETDIEWAYDMEGNVSMDLPDSVCRFMMGHPWASEVTVAEAAANR